MIKRKLIAITLVIMLLISFSGCAKLQALDDAVFGAINNIKGKSISDIIPKQSKHEIYNSQIEENFSDEDLNTNILNGGYIELNNEIINIGNKVSDIIRAGLTTDIDISLAPLETAIVHYNYNNKPSNFSTRVINIDNVEKSITEATISQFVFDNNSSSIDIKIYRGIKTNMNKKEIDNIFGESIDITSEFLEKNNIDSESIETSIISAFLYKDIGNKYSEVMAIIVFDKNKNILTMNIGVNDEQLFYSEGNSLPSSEINNTYSSQENLELYFHIDNKKINLFDPISKLLDINKSYRLENWENIMELEPNESQPYFLYSDEEYSYLLLELWNGTNSVINVRDASIIGISYFKPSEYDNVVLSIKHPQGFEIIDSLESEIDFSNWETSTWENTITYSYNNWENNIRVAYEYTDGKCTMATMNWSGHYYN